MNVYTVKETHRTRTGHLKTETVQVFAQTKTQAKAQVFDYLCDMSHTVVNLEVEYDGQTP